MYMISKMFSEDYEVRKMPTTVNGEFLVNEMRETVKRGPVVFVNNPEEAITTNFAAEFDNLELPEE